MSLPCSFYFILLEGEEQLRDGKGEEGSRWRRKRTEGFEEEGKKEEEGE